MESTTNSTNNSFYDLWNDKAPSVSDAAMEPQVEDYTLKQVKKKQPKKFVPKTKKACGKNAVDVPHPGASYNPSLDDHQILLMEASKAEKTKLKRERRLERKSELPPAHELVTPEIKLKEALAGLFPESSDEDEPEAPVEMPDETYQPAVAPISGENRKTSKTRKREKLQKKGAKQKRSEKLKKIRESEVYRLRSIKKQIKREEEERLKEKERKRRRRERLSTTMPPKLGPVSYEPPEVELKLSTELRGSLLELKPEGNLLEDRYKSLQKRGIIEPRVKRNRTRKYKLKKYEKRTHRDMPDGYIPR